MKHGLLAMAVFAVVSCSPQQQQGGIIGAIAGGAAGALFGDDHQDVIAGAAGGAALGVGVAAIKEDQERRRDYGRYGIPDPGYQDGRRSGPARQQYNPSDYPVAQYTGTENVVLSPYPPHRRVDVSGFRPGALARDPESGKIFRVP